MIEENVKFRRVLIKDIKPSPAEGIYIRKTDFQKFCIFCGTFFGILTVLAVFPKKNAN